ncbi:DUF1931 family protein [Hydrogenivirga sp.]
MARVMGVTKVEALFRRSAGLDLDDKNKVAMCLDIVEGKLHDLLLVAQDSALANGRDEMLPHDLPLTRGLRKTIREFEELNEEVPLEDVAKFVASLPPLKVSYSEEVREELPRVAGGLMVALAKLTKLFSADRRPSVEELEKARQALDLTL